MVRPRQFDEETVLCAARDQFWDAGYAATSLQDLMRVTGLGKGSLYAAFGDKHELFLRVLRRYATSLDEAVRGSIDSKVGGCDAAPVDVSTPPRAVWVMTGLPPFHRSLSSCSLRNHVPE